MEFANFEEFFKALDRLHEECVELRRSIQQDLEKASKSSRGKPGTGKPRDGKSLHVAAAQLCEAAQKQLEITLAKESSLKRERDRSQRETGGATLEALTAITEQFSCKASGFYLEKQLWTLLRSTSSGKL